MKKRLVDIMNSLNTSIIIDKNFWQNKSAMNELLREAYAEIQFTKKDGTKRNMKCTLIESEVVAYEKKSERTIKSNDNTLAVWDLDAAGWRSVNLDTIESMEVY
jgi:hypothetical protein